MKLIFLYGPPAVGKLSVAKELAKLTGYKLFHNHLTVDLVSSLYEFGTSKYYDRLREVREGMLETLVKDNIDVIFTFVYWAGEDDEVVGRMFDKVEGNGGEVKLVQLTTDVETLKKRVLSEDRKQYKKMSEVESLEKWIKQYELFQAYPNKESLVLDNTNIPPKEAAELIVEKLSLLHD